MAWKSGRAKTPARHGTGRTEEDKVANLCREARAFYNFGILERLKRGSEIASGEGVSDPVGAGILEDPAGDITVLHSAA